MTTLLGRLACGPTKRRERHDIARGKQSPIKITMYFAQIDRRLIGRFLSVFGEVMIKYAHPPLFQMVSIGGKLSVVFEIVLFVKHSLAIYSPQADRLVVWARILYFLRFQGASGGDS
jgi:hypothetical protein